MLYLCFASAAFIPLISTLIFFLVTGARPSDPGQNALQLLINNNVKGFCGFFFPLFLIIVVTRIVYLEHRSDTWKLLETQPVSRFSIFISKWELMIFISLLCLVSLFALSAATSWVSLEIKDKGLMAHTHMEWLSNLKLLVRIWIASFGLISLQYFLSLIIRSFAWPLSIGLIGIIAGSILTAFLDWNWYPYSAPSLSSDFLNGSNTGAFFIPHEISSLIWSMLFLWLAYQMFSRKKFAFAFLSPWSRLAATALVLSLTVFFFWLVNRPVTLHAYGKTIIAGTLSTEDSATKLIILRFPLMDTAIVVPIKNGKFHETIHANFEKAFYLARVGSSSREFYFGEGDSLYIDWTTSRRGKSEMKITGSRIAENTYLANPNTRYSFTNLEDLMPYYDASQFSHEMLANWDNQSDEMDHFKTVDNIKPREDFIQLEKKLLAINLLNLADNEYPSVFRVYYPNQVLKYDSAINRVRRMVDVHDSTLVAYSTFREYLYSRMEKTARQTNQPFLTVLMNEVPSEKVRNYLMYDYLGKTLSYINDSARRSALLEQSVSFMTDANLLNRLIQMNNRLNRLHKGHPAPDFIGEGLNGNTYSLQDLSGRYVVIDVWASWCGPCKEENPYFEQYAEQYTDEHIAFISISIDEQRAAWLGDAREKSKRVLQLWARNGKGFSEDYSIASIPRFILIDPKGKIVDAQFPRPSSPEFEAELQKEISFLRLTSY